MSPSGGREVSQPNAFIRGANKVMDVLGFYGLAMRSRAHDPAQELAGRFWGVTTAGFALSIEVRPATMRVREPVTLAIAIRNETGVDVRQTIPEWTRLFALDVRRSDGSEAEATPWGTRLAAARPDTALNALFPAAEPVQLELPLSDLYNLTAPGLYRITASCSAPAAASPSRVVSNSAEFLVS